MSINSKERNLWLCRNTTIEMVIDRGYRTDQKVLTYDEFMVRFPNASANRQSLRYICYKNEVPVSVHFLDDDKIGKSSLENIISDYQKENVCNIIFVVCSKISPACSNVINSNEKFNIEIFKEEELVINITKHVLVPKHRILSEDEKKGILEKLKIKSEQMPKILKKDPVCRYLGVQSGQVIEITRKSRTAGISLYYKIVEDKILKI